MTDETPPTSDSWQRISSLFSSALEMAPAERTDFLDGELGADSKNSGSPNHRLRLEVEQLLASSSLDLELPSPLAPLVEGDSSLSATPEAATLPAESYEQVPRHRLRERIGDGGMGTVYLADQLEPVRRTVAVKLLKAGFASSEVALRFDAERQALALMDHPGIAKVFDGGLSNSQRPFFSMELVDGLALDRYCDEHRLTLTKRIELFQQICAAVQHAHQKGVVHRDLKPSNILVCQSDDGPLVKVIDFGIAKALGERLGETTLHTVQGVFMGTPEYMSPEQAGDSTVDIDTRSDVYSLGILLYQLMVGVLPYEREMFRRPSAAAFRRALENTEPPRPSARLTALAGNELAQIEHSRRSAQTAIRRALNRDLDWIILKAIEKDRERRYSTVAELAADLERYLKHEPVSVGPPSGLYRVSKWVRRHRVATATGGVAIVLTILFGTFMAVQAHRLAQARDEAERALHRAHSVSGFLANVFTLGDPGTTGGEELSASQVLERGVERIDQDLSEDPEARADLLETLADVQSRLGHFEDARELQSRALDVRRELLDSKTVSSRQQLELATSMTRLGVIEARSMDFDRADQLLSEGLTLRRRYANPEGAEVADSLGSLGRLALQKGDNQGAYELFNESVELRRQLEDPPTEEMIAILGNSGSMLVKLGRFEDARAPLTEALDLVRRLYPDNRRLVFGIQNSLVPVERARGDQEAVVSLARSNLEVVEQMYDDSHPFVLTAVAVLASELARIGEDDEALSYAERAYEGNRQAFGPSGPPSINAGARLARILANMSTTPENSQACVTRAREVLQLLESAGTEAPRLQLNEFEATQILGTCLTRLGELDSGEEHLRLALTLGPAQGSEGELNRAETRFNLGSNLLLQTRFEEAEVELLEGLRGLAGTRLESPVQAETLVSLYEQWNQPEKAERYRKVADSAKHGSATFR